MAQEQIKSRKRPISESGGDDKDVIPLPSKKPRNKLLLGCFSSLDKDFVQTGGFEEHIPQWLIKQRSKDRPVSFRFRGGTAVTRFFAWQAILVFCGHTATTPMPTRIAYPGLVDPGADTVLHLCYASYQGLVHLLACLTKHASGAGGREGATTLEITVAGKPMFSVYF